MSELTTKLKELGEKWANLPECKEANEIADECMDLLPEVLERIEQLERARSYLRDSMLLAAQAPGCQWLEWQIRLGQDADSTSCGSDYIHRDEVRPLRDVLKACDNYLAGAAQPTNRAIIKQALAHAENLLKGEKE